MSDYHEDAHKEIPRRKLIFGGIAILTSMFVAFNPLKRSPAEKKEVLKMLDENGKLVEIDALIIESCRKRKVSNEELQSWVKHK